MQVLHLIYSVLNFEFDSFEFVSNFDIRISDLGCGHSPP